MQTPIQFYNKAERVCLTSCFITVRDNFYLLIFKEMSCLSLLLFLQSIEGEGAADDKSGPSVETKECIPNVIDSTSSQLTWSAQTTEIYIPVPDCLLPRNNELVSVILIQSETCVESPSVIQIYLLYEEKGCLCHKYSSFNGKSLPIMRPSVVGFFQ